MEQQHPRQFGMSYSTYLHTAILVNDHKRIQDILSCKRDLNVQYYGQESTPLRHAILQCNADIVEMLLKAGACPNHTLADGLSAFHYAVRTYGQSIRCNNLTGKLRVLLKLLRAGATVDDTIRSDLANAYYTIEGIYLKDVSPSTAWPQSARPGTPLPEPLGEDLYT